MLFRLRLVCTPHNPTQVGDEKEAVSRVEVSAGPGPCPFENRHAFTTTTTPEGQYVRQLFGGTAQLSGFVVESCWHGCGCRCFGCHRCSRLLAVSSHFVDAPRLASLLVKPQLRTS